MEFSAPGHITLHGLRAPAHQWHFLIMEFSTPGLRAPAHQWHFLVMESFTPGHCAPAFGQLAPMEFSTLGQDYLPFMEFSTPGRYAPTWGQTL